MNAASSVLSRVHPVSDRRHFSVPTVPTKATRRRILVVEDEAPIRELLRLHLSLAGFDIEEVSDGTAALERARADKFDLIVLDVMVPGLDGITLCRAIRSQSANTASAVMMLTARGSEADKVLGLESGADDYLTKPLAFARWLRESGRSFGGTSGSTARPPPPRRGISDRVTSRWTLNAAKRSCAAASSN